ncbi:PQ loop repeat-domain-containing protein [Glomus cerebriforme]|uniref:PQ loop repeat-domain-containing protein n=1 Tax=Glomus cerebriforme TaxID=658196 RepID=A0A397SLP5_9GLOM|nr:PQ loop repeat-domain-containing protein [Glomus cerebriforme]
MYNNEILSIVAGYISIASWVVVLLPQIWTNYKRKSGDSLSLPFLYIWAVGDLLNLTGAALQGLLKTMIILAVYYVLTDIIIILQVYYYRSRRIPIDEDVEETIPLINDNPPTPESRRQAIIKQFLSIFISLVGVCLTGVIAYVISSRNRSQKVNNYKTLDVWPQIFGWVSAFLYLGARIPQIIQNYKNKSTEGLSLAMFCFCVLGNISYSLSIILNSTDPEVLLINLAWIVGSGGTLIFDFIIFIQFYIYTTW